MTEEQAEKALGIPLVGTRRLESRFVQQEVRKLIALAAKKGWCSRPEMNTRTVPLRHKRERLGY